MTGKRLKSWAQQNIADPLIRRLGGHPHHQTMVLWHAARMLADIAGDNGAVSALVPGRVRHVRKALAVINPIEAEIYRRD